MTLDECFSILEIEPTESKTRIKAAYRDLLFVWHPDRFPNDPRLQTKAGEKLREINQAYEHLIQYLEFREQEIQARAAAQTPQRDHHQQKPPPAQDRGQTKPPPSSVNQPPRRDHTPDVPKPSVWNTPISPVNLFLLSLFGFVVVVLVLASIVDKPSKPSRSARVPARRIPAMLPSPTHRPTATPSPTPTWYPKARPYVPPPRATRTPTATYILAIPTPAPDPSTYVIVWKVPTVEVSSRWPIWAKGFTYFDALVICESLVLGGLDDWRLPTTKELSKSAPESIGLSWAWSPKSGHLARKGELVLYGKMKPAPVVCVRIQPLAQPTISSEETTQ